MIVVKKVNVIPSYGIPKAQSCAMPRVKPDIYQVATYP